jgi:hypothetical protein
MGGYTGTYAWRKLRTQILRRDGYLCQVRGPRCTVQATAVDHIIPVDSGGPVYDPENLRAICASCNVSRARRQKEQQGWRRSRSRIILVMGPPGAGKSTFIEQQRGPHDLVIDYDAMAAALGAPTHADVNAARNALLRRVRRGEVEADRVWIHSANPEAESIFPYHDLVVLDPGETEAATRKPGQVNVIADWYRHRAPVQRREW